LGLRDATRRPGQRLVVSPKLGHRRGDPNEPGWGAQVPTQQFHDRVNVTIQDGETLARVAGRERVVGRVGGDRFSVGSDPVLAERARVAARVDLEGILVDEPESDHASGQLDRVGDPGITFPQYLSPRRSTSSVLRKRLGRGASTCACGVLQCVHAV
jgi:hypothetical protein